MKILVADDESISRLLLSNTLIKWGKDVDTACDGNEAWAYFRPGRASDCPS